MRNTYQSNGGEGGHQVDECWDCVKLSCLEDTGSKDGVRVGDITNKQKCSLWNIDI